MNQIITQQSNLYFWLLLSVFSIIQFIIIVILLKRYKKMSSVIALLLAFQELISDIFKHEISTYIKKLQEKFNEKRSNYNSYRDMGGGGGASSPIVSDARLKEDISKINIEYLQLNNVEPVKFRYVKDNPYGLDSSLRYGFIAQDIENIIPVAVKKNADGFLCLDYNCLTALLVKRIKELSVEVENLKNQLNKNST